MTSSAPIAIFIYNRPEHLRRMLDSLFACDGFSQSSVYVFGDGPKPGQPIDAIRAARDVAREMLGERAVYSFADTNKGLARSVIDGVSMLTRQFGSAIVVEDDLVLSRDFLAFVNSGLEHYKDDGNVYQVSGHMFDAPEIARRNKAVMLPFTTTWGWATWERAWRQFDESAAGWEELRSDRSLRRRFNLDGAYDYASMMERQMGGRANSWGIRWYWSVFRKNGLVVYPPFSLVGNTGFDGAGTHGRGYFRKVTQVFDPRPLGQIAFPLPQPEPQAFTVVRKAVIRQNGGLLGKMVDVFKAAVRR